MLILRYDRIGDMILSTGIIRGIARSHPGVSVDVLASPANAPVLDGSPYVSSVIVADRRRLLSCLAAFRRIRRTRYDAILDCQIFSPSTTTLIMMLASRSRHRIGVAGRGIDDALTDPVLRPSGAHHYIDNAAVLAIPFGVNPAATDLRPEIHLTTAERARAESLWPEHRVARRLLINISGRPSRRWPDERFLEIFAALRAREGLHVIVIAAPDEVYVAQHLAAVSGLQYERTTNLREAFALVATADFVLTPDTAINHAASAFGKPAVGLFTTQAEAQLWGPYRTAGHAVVSATSTLDPLGVEPVRAAIDLMLAKIEAVTRST